MKKHKGIITAQPEGDMKVSLVQHFSRYAH